jgi:hypothetical protein
MEPQKPFGRRSQPRQPPLHGSANLDPATPVTKPIIANVNQASPPPGEITFPSADNEPWEWERSTRRPFKMPWRQLALMASLCFGIASIVLPDEMNDSLQWVLYGLTAMSLYAGLSKRLFPS